jgi:methylenetetrahydrofolate dehydrogenase (NADP+)/methenyltetrahydrofolate cyclohydrolase
MAPCTALAALLLAKEALPDLRGVEVVVVGASAIVGRPLALMLLNEGATVTVCHILTKDLLSHTRRADLLVCAAGKAALITPSMVKPGAVIIDVGINRLQNPDGTKRLVGDADPAVAEVASAMTPVPGGVGVLTSALLMEAVVTAAEGCNA